MDFLLLVWVGINFHSEVGYFYSILYYGQYWDEP